jgi:hypothetical protein
MKRSGATDMQWIVTTGRSQSPAKWRFHEAPGRTSTLLILTVRVIDTSMARTVSGPADTLSTSGEALPRQLRPQTIATMAESTDFQALLPMPYTLDHWRLGRGRVAHVSVHSDSPALEADRRADGAWWLRGADLPETDVLLCSHGADPDTRWIPAAGFARLCLDCESGLKSLDFAIRRARERAVEAIALTRPELFQEVGW